MDNLADDFSNQINEQLNVLKGNETAIITRQQDKKQLHEKYNNWLSSVQSVGESLYAFYREENIKARKSKKEPKSFKIDYLVSNFNINTNRLFAKSLGEEDPLHLGNNSLISKEKEMDYNTKLYINRRVDFAISN